MRSEGEKSGSSLSDMDDDNNPRGGDDDFGSFLDSPQICSFSFIPVFCYQAIVFCCVVVF